MEILLIVFCVFRISTPDLFFFLQDCILSIHIHKWQTQIKRYGKRLVLCCRVTKNENKNGIDCEVIKFDFNVFIMIVRDLFCDVGTFVFLIVVKLKIYRMDSIYKMLW